MAISSAPVAKANVFTGSGLLGNPAGVYVCTAALPNKEMQQIAAEVNLSETAFVLRQGDHWNIRWFTPTQEVDLCGHATLAAAYVLSQNQESPVDTWRFHSASGFLRVWKENEIWWIALPAAKSSGIAIPSTLLGFIDSKIISCAVANNYLICEIAAASQVKNFVPNFGAINNLPHSGLVLTARGDSPGIDFVSRCFYPQEGIPEDPVTGSAHALLAPFWQPRLHRHQFHALQVSTRGGDLLVHIEGDEVRVGGKISIW
ncbi:MAG: PhzF family phenazine biosynthesis protein [Bdellovibrionales bacterium]|nr:PhzF family phenazine biosynthesis protein [Bdellovibrionales bacterium]